MDSSRTRNLYIDACKAFLIFLVVFGHAIEISNLQIAKTLYKIIYIIHMPMFVFLAGYFIKPNKKIIQYKIFNYLYLYIKWSIVYGLVLYLLNHTTNFTVRPYWILWFIFSLLSWLILYRIFFSFNKSLLIFIAFLMSVVGGNINLLGYDFSLQRTVYFFPFFLAGVISQNHFKKLFNAIKNKNRVLLFSAACLLLLLTIGILDKFPRGLLYGSFSYESLGFTTSHGMLLRLLLISVSFCWIAILLAFSLNIRIPQIEFVGQHTLVIYLAHGIIVMIAKKYNLLKIDGFFSLIVVFVVCLIVTYVLANPNITTLLKKSKLL